MTLRRRLALFYALVLTAALTAFAGTVYAILEAEEAREPPVVAVLEPPDQVGVRLWLALLCALPVSVAVAVGGALVITRRGLQPLDEVVKTAERISADRLSERIPPGGPDEVARLVTSLNAMLERLEQSVGGMRRFTADASHELRTPLTALLGELELALVRPRTPEELRGAIERTREELSRMQRLLESLLTLARADASGLPQRPVALDLLALVTRVAEPYQALRRVTCDGQGRAHADGLWVERIVANLLDNACKFSAGEVAIHVGDGFVEVRDQGPGIAPGDGERIFERFYRGEAARAGSDGFGLGLPLARELARASGGELRCLTTQTQTGAAFRLELKRPEAEPLQRAKEQLAKT
jgi:signal transduction histidine kinase